MNTISRSTSLPGEREAVHLDIHQRAIIATADKYCAEPSPDGLAAYAAAIGLSVGKPASSAGSLTNSGSSSAASVGLRTQSITLMRDLMYRICEASANESIGQANVAVLLGQSQDLATVILAIEQLTGPVAASQAALIASAQSSSTATIAASVKQLELLIEALERANEKLEEVKIEKAGKEQEIKTAETKIEEATDLLTQAEKDDNQDSVDTYKDMIKSLNGELKVLKEELAELELREESQQEIVDDAKETRAKLVEAQAASLASGTTRTSGRNAFDSLSPANKLAAEASTKIAETVEEIVKHALNKPYLNEACISVITSPSESSQASSSSGSNDPEDRILKAKLKLQESCIGLINATVEKQRDEAKADSARSQLQAQMATDQLIELQSNAAIERVMQCLAEKGEVNQRILSEIIRQPGHGNELSRTLIGKNAKEMREFLSVREDQLTEIVNRIKSNPDICSK